MAESESHPSRIHSSLSRREAIAIALANLVAAAIAPRSTQARPSIAAQANLVRGDEINEQQRTSVEKGLAWLAAQQSADGGFSAGANDVAVASLAALAFMQAGNLPLRGRYGRVVQNCLTRVLAACQESGLVSDTNRVPMYGHGFATLFLAEVYGMTRDDAVKEKVQRAVRLIQKTQNAEGGWRYQPAPLDADISVTICQVMALRSARDAGIKVEKEVIDRAIAYVQRCQNPDGGFMYMASTGGPSGFPRSAAGVAALYYAGIFEGDTLDKGLQYVKRFQPKPNVPQDDEGHYFYGNYYAVQAMFLAGDTYWAEWYPAIRDDLCNRQDAAGFWEDNTGKPYGTAMALIILQMPNRYLPVYAGKGPGS